jgi:vacuolar-type H+-ATPase subunit C/Vma6
LLVLYRCKKYFNNYDLKFFLNYGKYITKEKIAKMSESSTFESFDELIENTPYKKDFKEDSEKNYRKFMYKKYKKCFREKYFDVGFLISYFELRVCEQRNIINILEGIRYKLDKEEIRKKITV